MSGAVTTLYVDSIVGVRHFVNASANDHFFRLCTAFWQALTAKNFCLGPEKKEISPELYLSYLYEVDVAKVPEVEKSLDTTLPKMKTSLSPFGKMLLAVF